MHLWPQVVVLYRLYLGVADGIPIARVCPYLRNGHAVGDAEIEPIWPPTLHLRAITPSTFMQLWPQVIVAQHTPVVSKQGRHFQLGMTLK